MCLLRKQEALFHTDLTDLKEEVTVKNVTAFIKIKAEPKTIYGYSDIAKTIAQFAEVESVHLISGANYDLSVSVNCEAIDQVGKFVRDCLAPIDGIMGISTHFIIGRYKEGGVELDTDNGDDRGLYTA